tara:strand:+ start:221 stop:3835 length:3615 start_codon:yes stop_codon:yes gene_type:complete
MKIFILNYLLKKLKSASLLALFFVFNISFAQEDYTVRLQDESIELPENIETFQWNQMPESAILNDGFVGWIQFYETPSQSVQNSFKENNLHLIEYIPNKAYLFYFPNSTSISYLKDQGVRSITPVNGDYKLESNLKNGFIGDWAIAGNNILVTLQYHTYVSSEFVINDLASKQISVKQQYKGSNNIDLSIPNNCLDELSNLSYVKWVEVIVAPSIKEDTRGRSLHRSSNLDTQTGAGRNYTGKNIGLLCRDDGIVGPHIDFQGRIDNSMASGSGQTHGDGVSGIMAGAGNLDPSMRGMAAESNLYVSNYASNFLDSATQTYINDGSVQITNSSYGDGCNAGYTTIAQTVDTQTNDIPTLLHVFSTGNSGTSDCGYGAGSGWGNITGGHKQGKNVIATANVYFDGSLVGSSSRGPATDGRIKPDIAANGQNQNSTNENNTYQSFGGTSGAAPGIAGISAQLYEAYGDLNGGNLPPSALIKASLLNTANEAGNIGPDYKFGWGIVNALRAGMLIEDSRYLSDEVSQGDTNTHSINVPSGTTQVRFMVYWSDPAATPGASPALVNDLDLIVTDPSSGSHEPWILDPTPNATTLNLPATLGPDHLNNMEQVLLNTPVSGDYDIEISGFNVPMGPQEYFVLYEIIAEELTMTYPNSGESFAPGETESLHWDAINTTADFVLEYSTDNGSSWNNITTVNATTYTYGWSIPNEVTGEALVRITSGSFTDESDEVFSIASLASNVDVSQICPDEATFAWNPVDDAESYDFYLLGDTSMDLIGNSTSTTFTFSITDPNEEMWAAVVAKNDTEGWESRRTIAIYHPGGLVNCSLADDLSVDSLNNTTEDFNYICDDSPTVISANIRNTGINSQSDFVLSYQIDSEPVVEETFTGTLDPGQQEVFNFATEVSIATSGNYTLTVRVELAGDLNQSNDEVTLDFYAATEATSLDFEEDFETNGMPPSAWNISNPDDSYTWEERTGVTGSDGNPSVMAWLNNEDYNSAGEVDILQTEIFNLTNASVPTLTFDLAKAQYSASYNDVLKVDISTDCGVTFTTIYEKDGLELSTIPDYNTSNWTPTSADEWRTEEIDLTPYEGEIVIFNFVNITGYSNSTYIDNINVFAGSLGISDNELTGISLYPNPSSEKVNISFNATNGNTYQIKIINSLGQVIQEIEETSFNGSNDVSLDVSNFSVGLYFVKIEVDNLSTIKKLLIK